MNKFVYHGSVTSNLKLIEPQKSTHGKEWVYATKEISVCTLFISGLGGDFTCSIGRDNISDKIYLCERFNGAFDYRYSEKSGSVYVLPSISFSEGKTSWDEEVVSEIAVVPVEEIFIPDIKEYLLQLEKQGKLIIKYFPEKINEIPEDDEDLIERAVIWTNQFGDRILEQVKLYHPDLLCKIIEKLDK